MLRDQPPVRHVERGGDDRPADLWEQGPVQQGDPGDDHGQHHEQRGQQPPGAAQPEVGQTEPAGALLLTEQEISYQVTAQREEDPHPEQPALSPPQVHVVSDDRRDGKSAQPV